MDITEQEHIKVVVFRLGQEEFGLPIKDVVSIEKLQPITAVPKTANYVRGITTIRGIVTLLIDLRQVMDVSSVDTDNSRIIVVKNEEQFLGLVVDYATDVLDLPVDTVKQSTLSTNHPNYLTGISKLNERLLFLIDTHSLLENLGES
ncbi:chemotaxis protein CheW [Bacillus sp. AK128]